MIRAWAALAAMVLGLGACGGSSRPARDGATAPTPSSATAYRGGVIQPPDTTPDIRLRDIDGRLVTLSGQRGHVTFVIFVYADCPDVCPLIVETLKRVQDLRPVERPRILAVSVDPAGDTPRVVRRFLRAHHMVGRMSYLLGSRPALERVWGEWAIATRIPKSDPELIEHSGQIYGIGASGTRRTLYPLNFPATDIAADVPLLAAS